jgi:hypothetical protein
MPMNPNHDTNADDAARQAEFLRLLEEVPADERSDALELLGAVAAAYHA